MSGAGNRLPAALAASLVASLATLDGAPPAAIERAGDAADSPAATEKGTD